MTTKIEQQQHVIDGGIGDGLEGDAAYADSVDEPITVRPTPTSVFTTYKAAELVIWHYGRGRPDVPQVLDDALEKLAEAINYDDAAATARHFPELVKREIEDAK